MNKFYLKIAIYILSLILCGFGLSALDFNRFIKQNKVREARVLFFVLLISLTYIIGQFVMSIMIYFN